jgi:hypothetical protein
MAFSATHDFGGTYRGETRILTVKANGGTVDVQVEHDAGVWISSEVIAIDFVGELFFGYAKVRLVPAGGATFKVR